MKKQIAAFVLSAFAGLAVSLGIAQAAVYRDNPSIYGSYIAFGDLDYPNNPFPTPSTENTNHVIGIGGVAGGGILFISDGANWTKILTNANTNFHTNDVFSSVYINEQIQAVTYGTAHATVGTTGVSFAVRGISMSVRTVGSADGDYDIKFYAPGPLPQTCIFTVPCETPSGQFYVPPFDCINVNAESDFIVSIENITCTTPPDIQGVMQFFGSW